MMNRLFAGRVTHRVIHGFACLGLVLLSLAGCGKSGPGAIPVRGTITLAKGPWPKPGVLYFTPIAAAEGFPMRPGLARFSTDGTFVVTTLAPEDGLLPGKYNVGVECWDVPPSMDPKAPRPRGVMDPKFGSAQTSGLHVEVLPGSGSMAVNFDVDPANK